MSGFSAHGMLALLAITLLGCVPADPALDEDAAASETRPAADGWDMQAYQFVTLTRAPERPDLDSAALSLVMRGHLAHLDSLYAAGVIRLVGPFGDDRDVRGFALLEVADSAAAVAHMAQDPSVQAGVFTLDSRPWWGPASIDVSGAAPKQQP